MTYDIHLINLKSRKDRMDRIKRLFNNNYYFNIKRELATYNKNGHYGCMTSHYNIIKNNQDKPYIIVAEDDIQFNDDFKNIYFIINKLLKNDDWDIFNGSPTFYNIDPNNITIKEYKKPFIKINWGQSTSFMIYKKKSYKKLLNLIDKELNDFKIPIDILISKNFNQVTYMYGYLFTQIDDYSSIERRKNKNYIDYQLKQEMILKKKVFKSIVEKIKIKIGVYSIFIGAYHIFYDNFVKFVKEKFFKNFDVQIFAITDCKNLKKYDNCTIIQIDKSFIDHPLPTLFRFKYYNEYISDIAEDLDYMFFINSNALINKNITLLDLPLSMYRYIFSLHDGFYNKDYNMLTYEKNNISTAFIPFQKNYNYKYIGGRFFGATKIHFDNLSHNLYNNIYKDLLNDYIAIWHDESHLNNYLFKYKYENNIFYASPYYHVPEETEVIKNIDNKYIYIKYLDKCNFIKDKPEMKDIWIHDKNCNRWNRNINVNKNIILYYKNNINILVLIFQKDINKIYENYFLFLEEYNIDYKIIKNNNKNIIEFIKSIKNILNYDCVAICNNCIINTNTIIDNIDYIKENDYIGKIIDKNYNNSIYYGPYMSINGGILLSSYAIKSLINFDTSYISEVNDDKLIGDILRFENYKIINHNFYKSFRKNIKIKNIDIKSIFNHDDKIFTIKL